jgi:hypothetical protein
MVIQTRANRMIFLGRMTLQCSINVLFMPQRSNFFHFHLFTL